MECQVLREAKDFQGILFGSLFLALLEVLKLPIPEVKVWCKEGGSYWNLCVHVPGRKKPKTKDISILDIATTKKQAINKAMHEVVTRLTYLYQEELHRLGVQTFGKRTATDEFP